MGKYWTYRGFPPTWQDALREANALTGMSQWIHLPGESWAESFSVAMVGGGRYQCAVPIQVCALTPCLGLHKRQRLLWALQRN